jgi:voltage-gated sodium channel
MTQTQEDPHKQIRKSSTSLTEESYTVSQVKVHGFLEGKHMKLFMGAVITVNALQVIYESDIGSKCEYGGSQSACDQQAGWLKVTNCLFLALYTFELSLRIYVHRRRCLTDAWDMFDGAIIVIGAISEILGGLLPSTGILRLFRLARLAKALRVIKLPPELYTMIHGFASALKAITMGAILMGLMLLLFAVVAIEVFNGMYHSEHMKAVFESNGCPDCYLTYSSIPSAFFELIKMTILGQGWEYAIIFIEEHPWTILFFMSVYFSVVLGMVNLVLAVIVEKALEAHQEDLNKEALEKEQAKTQASLHFVDLCQVIDADGSGSLTLPELLSGYDEIEEFRNTLQVMDICREDIIHMFKIMDKDTSGDVSYKEFAMQLAAIRTQELQTQICFIRNWTYDVKEDVAKLARGMRTSSQQDAVDDGTSAKLADLRLAVSAALAKEQMDDMVAKLERMNVDLIFRENSLKHQPQTISVDNGRLALLPDGTMLPDQEDCAPKRGEQVVQLDGALNEMSPFSGTIHQAEPPKISSHTVPRIAVQVEAGQDRQIIIPLRRPSALGELR